MTSSADIQAVHDEVSALGFRRFGHSEALRLGQILLELAQAEGHRVAIGVDLGDQIIFRAALPDTNADYQFWINRKFQTVRRFSAASYALELKAALEPDFATERALDPSAYVLCGGAVPLFVSGCMVGQIGCAGLASVDDHRLVINAMRALHKEIDASFYNCILHSL